MTRLLLAAGLAGLAACRPRAGDAGGRLDWEWTAAKTDTAGRFSAPGVARWCGSDQALLVAAESGDTGVALVLHLTGPLAAESVAVAPAPAVPRAGAAVRLADRAHFAAWAAREGWVRIASLDSGTVSGTFAANLDGREGAPPMRGTGRFRALPLARADSGCTALYHTPPR